MAFRVVEVDEPPLTSVAKEAEECSTEGNRSMGAVEREAVEGDPSEDQALTVAVGAVPPFRDALRDVEDDETVDETLRSNSASEVAPMEEHRRTIDEVCPLDSMDSERPTIFPQHFRASLL